MDIGNKEAIEKALTDALNEMIAEEQSEQSIKTNCVQLLTAVFQKLSYSHPDYRPAIQEASKKIVDIYKQRNIYDLLNLSNELANHIVIRLTSKNNDTILKQMVELIHRNYNENLKLETLSETFNYNSAYLGKLFKNYTGEYFNTYLDKVRIDKAKELLQQDLKVYQVAERIGYTNVDYFHSKFKKYVGISPSAYRREQS
ncbi:helix-turn-helix transcriptional regulator [Marinicrinis lubricantis]|uniref:Helix-turn-helix transcriptional regulator n=1 Tax=Marinicrinis lubricantis TaxID=2086470 RepID=A0ABW1IL69_9BACL